MSYMTSIQGPGTTKYYIQNRNKVKSGNAFTICRSSWERNFCKILDMNNDVLFWESEPIGIPYYNPVKQREAKYFPDFIAKCKTRSNGIKIWLIEVKPFKECGPPIKSKKKTKKTLLYEEKNWLINSNKWKAAQRYCKLKGWQFKIITEKNLFR